MPTLPSLDGLIRFSDPKQCEFSEPMSQLFASLVKTNADYSIAAGKPVIPRAYSAAFGKPISKMYGNMLSVSLPVRGTWKGLRVVSMATNAVAESDDGGVTIGFAATKQSVVAKLNEAGMALPVSGRRRADENAPMEWIINVEADGHLTYLGCS